MQPPAEQPPPRAQWQQLAAAESCPSCGLTVLVGWEYCEWCGADLTGEAAEGKHAAPFTEGMRDAARAAYRAAQPAPPAFLQAVQQQPPLVAAPLIQAVAVPNQPVQAPAAPASIAPGVDPILVTAPIAPGLALPDQIGVDPGQAVPVLGPVSPVTSGPLPPVTSVPVVPGKPGVVLPLPANPGPGVVAPVRVGQPVIEPVRPVQEVPSTPVVARPTSPPMPVAPTAPVQVVPKPTVPIAPDPPTGPTGPTLPIEPIMPVVAGQVLPPPGHVVTAGSPITPQPARVALLSAYETNSPLHPAHPITLPTLPDQEMPIPTGPGAVVPPAMPGPQPANPVILLPFSTTTPPGPFVPVMPTLPVTPPPTGTPTPALTAQSPMMSMPKVAGLTPSVPGIPAALMPAPSQAVRPGVQLTPQLPVLVVPGPPVAIVATPGQGPVAPAASQSPAVPKAPGRPGQVTTIIPWPMLWRGGGSPGRVSGPGGS